MPDCRYLMIDNKQKYRIKNSEAAHNVKVMEAIVKSSKKNKKIYL